MIPFDEQCSLQDVGASDCFLLSRLFDEKLGKGAGSEEFNRLSVHQRAELIQRFIRLLRQLSALMRVSDEAGETTLDTVLFRLISVTSESLNADRSSLFLYDPETDELFSRVAQGEMTREIRFPAWRGIAGMVFQSGVPLIIHDAYADPRFNPGIDEHTGYKTRSVLCVPLRNWEGKIVGVTEVLNRREGDFNAEDQALLEALTSHAASVLESMQLNESIEQALHDEAQLLGITTALSSELKLDALLVKIMGITTEVLQADRSTLLLYDDETDELRSMVAEGLTDGEIRVPTTAGIAGAVFTSGDTINIADAYSDKRFNPEVDRATGYRTQSILCVPVTTNSAEVIGIIQVLNKKGGPFSPRDEKRLLALASQAAIAIENARLFDTVLETRNYSESILQSLSNGVITLDSQGHVIKANPAALRILCTDMQDLRSKSYAEVFDGPNRWIAESMDKVALNQVSEVALDAEIHLTNNEVVSVNLNVEPLIDFKKRPIGFMLVLEDITSEKRVKSTMARYMSRELSERLLETNEAILGGQAQEVSILFSDIRNFTGMTENLGAQATVAMLNEYFSEMAELVFHHGGILDKYIGDGLMALFGTPFPAPEDADNSVKAAVDMVRILRGFNNRRVLEGHQSIDIRIGVSTGEVIAGNIGSPRRMDYTVIGHTVNVAARVENANSFYGTEILVTEATRQALQGDYRLRELDLIRVKGVRTPVAIYEVLDGRDPQVYPQLGDMQAVFSKGVDHYRRREWNKAIGSFTDAQTLWPGDMASRLYLRRCERYLEVPPPDDWDGVWTMTHKQAQ